MAQITNTEAIILSKNVPDGYDRIVSFPVNAGEATLTISTETTSVQYFPAHGALRLVDLATLETAQEVTITPTIASAGAGILNIIFGEYSKLCSSCPSNQVRVGKVSESDIINDFAAQLTGKSPNQITVSAVDESQQRSFFLKPEAGSASPAAENAVAIDTASGTLYFPTDTYRGRGMQIGIENTISNVQSWFNEASPQTVGSVSMESVMTMVTSSMLIMFPSIKPEGDKTFTLGSEFTLDVTFRAETPPDQRMPFTAFDVTDLFRDGLL